jgi:SAM-dependent methyltransferase
MIDYEGIRRFYDRNRGQLEDDPNFLRGTVEETVEVARFRARAESRHLARVLKVEPGYKVLDLGAGSGRYALFFAERGAHVTAVELVPANARAAIANAERRGLLLDCRVGSILTPPLERGESFDIVHIGGVLVYINERDLPRVHDVVCAHTRPGSMLVLREPVDPHGPSEDRRGEDYRALFRKPEAYVQLFEPEFRLLYQRTTVSHLVPRGTNTSTALQGLRSGSSWPRRLALRALPWVGYIDYALLGLEEQLRASPARTLLGDPGVVQHFYVFTRRAS